jgi:hypothetical protein
MLIVDPSSLLLHAALWTAHTKATDATEGRYLSLCAPLSMN